MNKALTRIKKYGNSFGFYLNHIVKKDSSFPFKDEDLLILEVQGNEVVIRKKRKLELIYGHKSRHP